MGYRRGGGFRWPGRVSSSPKIVKEIPTLSRFDGLGSSDLKKIILGLESLQKRRLEILEFNKSARVQNSRLEADNEARKIKEEAQEKALQDEFRRNHLDPLYKRMDEIWNHLYQHRLNLLDRVLRDAVEINVRTPSFHVTKKGGESWLNEYKAASKSYNLNLGKLPEVTRSVPQKLIPLKKEPNPYVTPRINGASFRIYYNTENINTLKEILSKKVAEEVKEKEKVDALRARAASKELEVRAQARQFLPKGLSEQLKLFSKCPYCRGELSGSSAHLDHIHPVSKGGLSTNRNLVFVCSTCNLKKKDKTLGVYCSIEKIDVLFVHEVLGKLRKDF
jgi:hypothetical protein